MSETSRKVGRPEGYRKPEGVRTMRSLKAYDDEWQIIKTFAAELKKGDKQKCLDFIQSLKG